MMSNQYAKAYTEILEILKYLPKKEYEKIPQSKIEFYEENQDKNYTYQFDITKPTAEVTMLDETKVIIISLFRDFFASENQKQKLQSLLQAKENAYQEKIREQYKVEDIFQRRAQKKEETYADISLVVVKKSTMLNRIMEKIKNFLRIGRH